MRLENPMDRGTWQATLHSVIQSRTRLKRLSMHTQMQKSELVYKWPGPQTSPVPPLLSLGAN